MTCSHDSLLWMLAGASYVVGAVFGWVACWVKHRDERKS